MMLIWCFKSNIYGVVAKKNYFQRAGPDCREEMEDL